MSTSSAATFCVAIPCTEDEMQDITACLFKGHNYNRESIEADIENIEMLVEHLKTRFSAQVQRGNIVIKESQK